MTAGSNAPGVFAGSVASLTVIATALVVLTAVGPTLHLAYGGWALLAIFLIGSAGAFVAAQAVSADQQSAIVIILLGAVSMRLTLLFVEPYLSTDIYRYVWDGRVQAAGVNPYRYMPAAPELSHLRDAAIYPHINRADYAVTIYPPVAQAFFLAVTRLGESLVVMKLGLIACEAAIMVALVAILRHLGYPLVGIAAYAWHPLPIWEIAGSGHVDAAMCALLTVGLLLFLRRRNVLAGVAVTLGALIKPTALLALPSFWRPWDWRLPMVVALTIALTYLPYLSVGAGVFGYLGGYVDEEGLASGHGINALRLLENVTGPIPHASTVYVIVSVTLLIAFALAIAFRGDRSDRASIAGIAWLLVAFLILASPHYPWYFLALVPLLSLAPSRTAWAMTALCPLLYDSIGGVGWPDYDQRSALFLVATAVAFAFDVRGKLALRHKPKPSTLGKMA